MAMYFLKLVPVFLQGYCVTLWDRMGRAGKDFTGGAEVGLSQGLTGGTRGRRVTETLIPGCLVIRQISLRAQPWR